MLQVLRTLAEVDYPYMVMPDHLPRHADDPRWPASFCLQLRLHQSTATRAGNDRLIYRL